MINDILRNAVNMKASDVHITVGQPPLFRIHTVVTPSDFPIVTPEGSMRIAHELIDEKRWAHFEELRDADFSYEIPGLGRFRVNAHFQRKSVALAFRTINDKVRQIEQLFLPDIVNKLTYLPRGLVLVTGPTGSGKSTTLAAMIDAINRREAVTSSRWKIRSNTRSSAPRAASSSAKSAPTARHSPAVFVTRCVRTRMSSWSAKCATSKPSARQSPPRKPVTWCSARCTP